MNIAIYLLSTAITLNKIVAAVVVLVLIVLGAIRKATLFEENAAAYCGL